MVILCYMICMQPRTVHLAPTKQIIVGLISTCNGTNLLGKTSSQIMNKTILLKKFSQHFNYTEIDICEDEEILMKSLLDLTLDPSVYLDDNITLNINSIFTYMPERLLTMTVAFLQFTNITVFPLTKTSDDHWLQQQKNVLPIYHTDKITEGAISRLISHFQLRYIVIFEILTSPRPQLRVEKLRKRFGDIDIRYFALHLKTVFRNAAAMQKILSKLKADIHLKAVVLVGNQVVNFMMKAHRQGVEKFWVLFTNSRTKKSKIDFVVFNNCRMNREVLEIPLYHNETICNEEYIQGISDEKEQRGTRVDCLTRNITIKPLHATKTNHFYKLEKTLKSIILNSISMIMRRKQGESLERHHIHQHTNGEHFVLQSTNGLKVSPKLLGNKRPNEKPTHNNNNANRLFSNCQQIIIQRKRKPEILFYKQIDFHCRQCQFPYYKDDSGGCKLCPRNTIPFQNQSTCYDARVYEIRYKFMYALHGVGGSLCLFILAVYVKYRQTPIVRSSHFVLSTTQVTCCLALFISFPLLSSAEPSVWLCTVRQTTTSLLLVAAASIVVCKAEQFLTICTMKTLMYKKTKRDLFVKQTLIFLFIMLTDCIVIVSSFPFPSNPTTRIAYLDAYNNKYNLTVCPLSNVSVIQIIYCILILLFSIVQALRGHNKLPDAYNDGNAIITSSATSACCLLFLVIYSAQEGSKRDFLSIINISLSISLLTLLISLYGMKIYVILFQPNKNTKHYIKTYERSMDYAQAYIQKREDIARAKNEKKKLVVQDAISSYSYAL